MGRRELALVLGASVIAAACGFSGVGMVELDGRTEASDGGGGGRDAAPPCPGDAGPTMVDVGGYCIDSTEVTEAPYATFLAAQAGGR